MKFDVKRSFIKKLNPGRAPDRSILKNQSAAVSDEGCIPRRRIRTKDNFCVLIDRENTIGGTCGARKDEYATDTRACRGIEGKVSVACVGVLKERYTVNKVS